MGDQLRRAANVLCALMLFPAASFSALTGIGRSVGEVANASGFSPETPAGYAFAIWGVIFSLTLIYAARQALTPWVTYPLYREIGWATALSSALNALWMIMAQTMGDGWWLAVTIVAILTAALTTFFRVLRQLDSLDAFDRWITLPMSGLLAGWLSAAVWLNLSSVLELSVPNRFGLDVGSWALGVLAAVAIFGWMMLARARGNFWYAGTLLWALIGVVVANLTAAQGVAIVAYAAGAVALMTVLLTFVFRGRWAALA